MDLPIRFVLGGVIVSVFSVMGDILRPKSLSGITGAAPSVALATLGIAFVTHGAGHVSIEVTSMLAGSVAFIVYNVLVSRLLMRRRCSSLVAATAGWALWLAVAFALWAFFLR